MFRIKALFSATVLLLFLGAVIWVSSRSTPIPTATLPDGTLLRIEAVTYGTNHVFTLELEWKRKLRERLPTWMLGMLGPAGYRNESNQTEEQLIIWVSQYDPAKDAYVMPVYDACEIIAENGQRFHIGSSSSGDDAGFKEKHFHIEVFPRRQKSFKLRFEENGQVVDMEVTNPVIWSGTEWTARALPQTQTVNQVEFILQNVDFHQSADGNSWVNPTFAVYSGTEDRTAWYEARPIYTDVTGNRNYNTIPTTEPVWKVRTRFYRTAQAQFATNEIVTLPEMAMPASGKYEIIPVTEELKAAGVKFMALTGPGMFRFENGQCTSAQPWEPYMSSSSSSSIGDQHWRYQFTDKEGRMVFITEHDDPTRFEHHRDEQNFLIRAHRSNGEIKQATSNGWSSTRRNDLLTMARQFFFQDFPTNEVLRFELINDSAVKADYLIATPQPAAR